MAELGLFPNPTIMAIQGVIFVGALFSANHFIIKPALRLHNERRRRTSGAVEGAKSLELRAEALEVAYLQELKVSTDAARNLRLSEVLAGQAEAESILGQANVSARAHVDSIQTELREAVVTERAKLPALVESVSASILTQLGATSAVAFALILSASSALARAAEDAAKGGHGPVDFWYGIFWPYFQFLCFVAAVVYFGGKTLLGVLESRRDALRLKLSEAKQAVVLAERKAAEYERKMAGLQNEIDTLRSQYIEDGVRERNKIVADARSLASNLLRDAERAAGELVIKAREDIRRDLVSLAIEAVEQKLAGGNMLTLEARLKKEALQGVASLGSGGAAVTH